MKTAVEGDLRDFAAEAAILALEMGSEEPDAVLHVAKLGKTFPLVASVLRTLKATREKLDAVKKQRAELVGLTERCTYIAACLIVKYGTSTKRSQSDVRPLEECVEAVEQLVGRCGRRGKLSMVLKATRVKNEISELHALIGNMAAEMGLAGIVAVFKGVLVSGTFRTLSMLLSFILGITWNSTQYI